MSQLSQSYDSHYGGFGSAPKFPRPVEHQLMLYYAKKLEEAGKSDEAKKSQKMVLFSLQCMAKGGIHDHLGGGFHRYSVDERWHGLSCSIIIFSGEIFLFLEEKEQVMFG